MKFDKPLTVRLRTGQTIVRDEFNLVLTDDSRNRRAIAQLLPVSKPFILWQGDSYVAAGDYTQAQAEARLRELLGDDPAAALTTPAPSPPPNMFPPKPAAP
jgi:hypothetical protein